MSYSFGADVSFPIGSHAVISPVTRFYFLKEAPWRYGSTTSWTTFNVGVTAGVQF